MRPLRDAARGTQRCPPSFLHPLLRNARRHGRFLANERSATGAGRSAVRRHGPPRAGLAGCAHPLSNAAHRPAAHRACASSRYLSARSTPADVRPKFSTDTSVEPVPRKGLKRLLPGHVARIGMRQRSTEEGAPCEGLRCASSGSISDPSLGVLPLGGCRRKDAPFALNSRARPAARRYLNALCAGDRGESSERRKGACRDLCKHRIKGVVRGGGFLVG